MPKISQCSRTYQEVTQDFTRKGLARTIPLNERNEAQSQVKSEEATWQWQITEVIAVCYKYDDFTTHLNYRVTYIIKRHLHSFLSCIADLFNVLNPWGRQGSMFHLGTYKTWQDMFRIDTTWTYVSPSIDMDIVPP